MINSQLGVAQAGLEEAERVLSISRVVEVEVPQNFECGVSVSSAFGFIT